MKNFLQMIKAGLLLFQSKAPEQRLQAAGNFFFFFALFCTFMFVFFCSCLFFFSNKKATQIVRVTKSLIAEIEYVCLEEKRSSGLVPPSEQQLLVKNMIANANSNQPTKVYIVFFEKWKQKNSFDSVLIFFFT